MVVLTPEIARWSYAQTGKSEEFLNLFRQLQEQTRPSDDGALQRYDARDIAALGTLLTFRQGGYATALFQLCHVVRAAAVLGPSPQQWLYLLLGSPAATTPSLRRHIEELLMPRPTAAVRLEGNGIHLAYSEGVAYEIAWGRLPLLVALLDVSMTALGKPLLARLDELAAGPHRYADVQACQSDLARLLGGYLDGVLRSKQQLEKFDRLVGFLERQDGAEIDFSDASLLAYWRAAAADPEGFPDVVKYRTAFEQFVDALLAMTQGVVQAGLQDPEPLGGQREEGEWDVAANDDDPDHGLDLAMAREAEDAASWVSPLARFAEPALAATDLLNSAEQGRLELLLAAGPAGPPLALSLLRAEVMGMLQNNIIQARRDVTRGKPDAAERCRALIELAVLDEAAAAGRRPRSYAAQAQLYREAAQHVQRMLLACGHVGVHWGMLDPAAAGRGDARESLAEAARSFGRIARAGFADALTDRARGQAFVEAIDPLSRIARQLAATGEAIAGLERRQGLDRLLADDRPVFRQTFTTLYATGEPA